MGKMAEGVAERGNMVVDIVKYYFNKNYTCGVILYCLGKYHGIIIVRGTLLNRLKDYGLRH